MLSQRFCGLLAGALSALLLTGCPYESDEPLAPRNTTSFEPRLVGAWRCLSAAGNDDKVMRVTFARFDEQQYVIVVDEQTDGEGPGLMRAHAGKFAGVDFLNLQSLEEKQPAEPRKWWFARYSLTDPDLLRLRFVEDKLLKEARTPAEARALIQKHLESNELYDTTMICLRRTAQ